MGDNLNAVSGALALLGFADDSDTFDSSRACAQDTIGGDVSTADEG